MFVSPPPDEPLLPPEVHARGLLSLAESCQVLGIKDTSLKTHVLPEVRTVRVGRRRLIPASELERWAREHIS